MMARCPNQSTKDEFNVLAFSASSVGQLSIFVGVLLMYFITLIGNVTIIVLISTATRLHTPMYFFLFNLSLVDIISTSSCIPLLLRITLTQQHAVSFHGCILQLYFYVFCALGEILILTSMAYDRYVAVCRPLQYYLIMNKKICVSMAASTWVSGALNALMHSLLTSILLFCRSRDINNFFCDLNTLISLSTSDTKSRKMLMVVEDVVLGIFPFGITTISYVFIISNILKINSRDGRLKSFSSCTSHLITVALFYGPSVFLYMSEEFKHSKEQDKLLSMLYLVVVPMLNPLVYSLRNKDIWEAIATLGGHRKKHF